MGDFNDEAEDKSLQVLKEIDGKTGSFLNNLMEGDQHNWKGTLVHDREWFLFDQFIVSEALVGKNNMRIKNFEARIYSNQELLFTFPNGTSKPNATYGGSKYFGGYSDHLPIFLFLTQ